MGRTRTVMQPQPQPQHRVYQSGKRHMELIASVSRSSGLEKDGDALRDPNVQEEYRAFIQGKVDEYWKRYPWRYPRDTSDEAPDARRNRKEMEENLMILFRKLREGLLSVQRRDVFALEVYETSLYLSVLFKSPVQTTSTLSHLFPDLYVRKHTSKPPSSISVPQGSQRATSGSESASALGDHGSTTAIPRSALATTLTFLLHQLVQAFPSQIAFHTQLRQLHPALQSLLRAPDALPSPAHPSGDPSPSSSTGPSPSSPSSRSLAATAPAPSPHPSSFQSQARSQSQSQSAQSHSRGAASTSQSRSPAGSGSRSASAPARDAVPAQAAEASEQQRSLDARATHAYRSSASASASAPAREDVAEERESSGAPATAHGWLLDLAGCLRARNYARLDGLTRRAVYARFVPRGPVPRASLHSHSGSRSIAESASGSGQESRSGWRDGEDTVQGHAPLVLELEALGTLVGALLEKARGRTWDVLRMAYREVSLRAPPSGPVGQGGTGTTEEWLARSLVLRPRNLEDAPSAGRGGGDGNGSESIWNEVVGSERSGACVGDVEAWLEERGRRGEARRKEGEGMEGRWVLVKA
ncbi:hypothetical protein C8Q80DRAFT_1140737 [Daedaleopsis nitida]|nr:hypothetical protein C8Q80DRAFT_1140737 [Daedaleopsis nitida]